MFENILDFDEYFKTFSIHEKMGVVERNLYKEVDVYGISKIVNDFINNVSLHVDENFETIERFFDDIICIKYRPNENKKNIFGETRNGIIFIYRKYTEENKLDFKYTVVHELVHMMNQILSDNNKPYEDLNVVEKLRYILLKTSLENLVKHDVTYIHHLLYIIDLNELYSINQNAYITAFKFKIKEPQLSNYEICLKTLKKFKMTNSHLALSIKDLKNEDIFENIIYFLIGEFNEIGKNKPQSFFDKSIFELDVVKDMRKEMKTIVYNESSINAMVKNVVDVVETHKSILKKHKEIIINSFIEHLKYWFNNAQKRMGKAIQLGIDDTQ